jgi:hypothetical protein
MNERMIELYKQAQEFAYKNISEEYWNTDNFHAIVSGKFAELIVKECVERASIGNGHGNNQWDRALTFAAKNIKEHFGVEE